MKFFRPVFAYLFTALLLLPSTASSGFFDPFTKASIEIAQAAVDAISYTEGFVFSRFQKKFDSLADFFDLNNSSFEFGVFDKDAGESFKFDPQKFGNQHSPGRGSYEDDRDRSNYEDRQSKGPSLRTCKAAIAAMVLGFGFLLHLIEQTWPHSTDGYIYHPPDGKYEFHGDNADRGNWWEGNVDNDGHPKQTQKELQEQQLRDFLQQQQVAYQAYAKQIEIWRLEELERRIVVAKLDCKGSPLPKPSIPTDLDPAIVAIIEQAEAAQETAAKAAAKAPQQSIEEAQATWAHEHTWFDDIWDHHDDTWDYDKLAKKEISLLHNKDSDDSALGVLNSADRTLSRTIELMKNRYYETIENPWPTASAVVAGACLPPYAVGLIVAWELFENRRELLQKSKKFARLMRDDTPEGVAQLITFCLEFAALHKVTGALLPVVDAAMPRIKETVSTLVQLAEQERQLAAAAGDGLALRPFNDMLDGMRAAMSVSRKDLLLEATSASAAEGNNAASSIKQRLTKGTGDGAALTQAEEMGTAGTGLAKAAEKEVVQASGITVDQLQCEFMQKKNPGGPSTSVFYKPKGWSGGKEEALADFYRLNPVEVEEKICSQGLSVKVGKLADGRTVVVRETSRKGEITIEIQGPGPKDRIKFRYAEHPEGK